MGFGSLKIAVEPINEDFERYLLASLIEDMNNLLLLNLAADFVSERFPDEDVFVKTTDHTALVLHGASHLRNMAKFVDTQE